MSRRHYWPPQSALVRAQTTTTARYPDKETLPASAVCAHQPQKTRYIAKQPPHSSTMFVAGMLCLWGLTATIPALQVPPDPPSPLLASRLEQLEGLLADHQAQLRHVQGEVRALQKEKEEMGRERLEEAVRDTPGALQYLMLTLTQENRALKTELGEVKQRLATVTSTQQDLVTQCGTLTPPGGEESRPPQHVHTARAAGSDPISQQTVTNQLAERVELLTADVQALKTSDAQQHQDLQNAGSSTFIRWGSSACPAGSELVYSGVTGGSWYDHTGSAANTLCVTLSPRLQSFPANLHAFAMLYGAEYETYDAHKDKDAVCAVCRPSQPTTIMVPGTNVCSAGWTLQYSGFLMAGYYGHRSGSEFICVDVQMESEVDSHPNNDGRLLYYTATRCGSLPCPPYDDNRLVTCVVCSK